MRLTIWAGIVLLAGMFWLVAGCDETDRDRSQPFHGYLGVAVEENQILYFPGDTITSHGWVVVSDIEGTLLNHVRIGITSTEHIGRIEFADSLLRDTTNRVGRVEFFYRATPQFPTGGADTITATFFELSSQRIIIVQPTREIGYQYHIAVGTDTVSIRPPDRRDSTMVTVTITDSLGNPPHNGFDYPGMGVDVIASCGGLGSFSQLDTSGVITAWWYFRPGLIHDICCVTVRQDSACVVLLH
jgi:hypothetical protein